VFFCRYESFQKVACTLVVAFKILVWQPERIVFEGKPPALVKVIHVSSALHISDITLSNFKW
jgi:hypothetical protein